MKKAKVSDSLVSKPKARSRLFDYKEKQGDSIRQKKLKHDESEQDDLKSKSLQQLRKAANEKKEALMRKARDAERVANIREKKMIATLEGASKAEGKQERRRDPFDLKVYKELDSAMKMVVELQKDAFS